MRSLILCFFTLCTLVIQAQTYQVFRTKGNVLVYKNKQWVEAEKRLTINYADSINITNSESVLSLLNADNNQIIEIKQVGKHNAKKIIDATIKQSSNVLAYTTKNIAQSVGSNNKKQNYNIYGATMRADQNTIESNQSIAKQIAILINDFNSDKHQKNSKILSLEKVELSEDIIGFNVINNSGKAYVVNILRIPRNENPSFCFNFDKTDSEYFFALVSPNSTTSFNHIQLKKDDATYILIATEHIFDSSWVEQAIVSKQINKDTKVAKKIKIETFTIH